MLAESGVLPAVRAVLPADEAALLANEAALLAESGVLLAEGGVLPAETAAPVFCFFISDVPPVLSCAYCILLRLDRFLLYKPKPLKCIVIHGNSEVIGCFNSVMLPLHRLNSKSIVVDILRLFG